MNPYISQLDTERFGFGVAKIDEINDDLESTLLSLKNDKVKLVISRVDLNNITIINILEKIGFELKDTQLKYQFKLKYIDNFLVKFAADKNLIIRDAIENDVDSLIEIAVESFNNYGHYFADKLLDKSKCIEIYKDWIKRSYEDRNVADKVLVAELNNEIAGFLTFKIINKENNYAAGGIGAVSSKFRGKNIFKVIAIEGLKWGKSIGLDWEEHNVLVNNYSVNRSFSSIGFHIVNSFVTLHYWFPD